jgi:predicted dienelactone hydrolase
MRLVEGILGGLVIAAAIGFVARYRMPVISFPEPPGHFGIGTQTFYFADPNRAEEFAATPGGRRRFVAQIWYPARSTNGPMAPYRDANALTWRTAQLRFVKTHAHIDAPIAQTPKRFPVVFFSPSAGGYRSQNTFLTEFLVSYGYIVIGFDHPDSCARVAFPDGSVMNGLPDAWLNLNSRAALEQSSVKTEKILKANVEDMQFVFNELMRGSGDAKLDSIVKHMDLSRVAAIGHSFGGAAAAEICRTDPRFKAGVNMDGWMFSGVMEYGIPKPFLFLLEDDPLWFHNQGPFPDNFDGMARLGTLEYHQCVRRDAALYDAQVATLLDGAHLDFSDLALLEKPWPWARKKPVSIETMHHAVSKLVLAFLDQTLEARENQLASAETELHGYFRFGVSTAQPTLEAKTENAE